MTTSVKNNSIFYGILKYFSSFYKNAESLIDKAYCHSFTNKVVLKVKNRLSEWFVFSFINKYSKLDIDNTVSIARNSIIVKSLSVMFKNREAAVKGSAINRFLKKINVGIEILNPSFIAMVILCSITLNTLIETLKGHSICPEAVFVRIALFLLAVVTLVYCEISKKD